MGQATFTYGEVQAFDLSTLCDLSMDPELSDRQRMIIRDRLHARLPGVTSGEMAELDIVQLGHVKMLTMQLAEDLFTAERELAYVRQTTGLSHAH